VNPVHFWWGSVFLVNVPVMVVLLVGGIVMLPEQRDPTPGPWPLPRVGLSLFGVLGLVYAVKEGSSTVVVVVVGTVVGSRCETAARPPLPHTRRFCADDRMCQGWRRHQRSDIKARETRWLAYDLLDCSTVKAAARQRLQSAHKPRRRPRPLVMRSASDAAAADQRDRPRQAGHQCRHHATAVPGAGSQREVLH
jgi:hypothetical protein